MNTVKEFKKIAREVCNSKDFQAMLNWRNPDVTLGEFDFLPVQKKYELTDEQLETVRGEMYSILLKDRAKLQLRGY